MVAGKEFSINHKKYWLIITAIALLVFILSLMSLSQMAIEQSLSPLWFTTAALLAALFILPFRCWTGLLLGSALALIAASLLAGAALSTSLPLTVVTLLEAALGAWLLRYVLDPLDPLNGILSWLKFFLIGVVAVPAVGALTVAYFFHVPAVRLLPFVMHWLTAEGVGILALTPVGILCRRPALIKMLKQKTWIEMSLTAILSLIVSYLAIKLLPFPFTFAALPLFIGAIRLHRFEAFCLFLIVTLALYFSLTAGFLHLNIPQIINPGLLPQMPLLIILIPANAMAIVMHAFRVERSNILQSETRFRYAMEYSAIGMALVSLEGTWLQVNKSLCRFLKYSPRQLEQLSFQEITHPDDLTTDLKQLSDLVNGVIESYTLEKRYIRSDGEIVWALLAVSLVRDQHEVPLYFISQIEDITEVKQSEIINRRLMERITLANEAGGMGIWEWNIISDVMNWDKRMEEIYSLPPDQKATYDYWLACIIDEDRDMALQYFYKAMDERKPFSFEFRIQGPGQELRHIRLYANVLADENDRAVRMLGISLDFTSEARLTDALHEEKERLHITLDSIGDAVISMDKQMCINFMNPVAEKMTGWLQREAHGKHIDSILQLTLGHDGPALPTLLQSQPGFRQKASALQPSVVLHSRSGQFFDIQHNCTPLNNINGAILGAVLVIKDISESRHLMQQLSYNALHDDLTGLPNRANFAQHLDQALHTAIGQKRRHALVFIDLDRFKEINDRAGHAAGDALLLELGLLMQKNIRQYDCLARLGGDEFGLILPDCTLADAKKQVQRIIDAINSYSFHWEDKLYAIGGSAGITWITEENFHTKEVMGQADIACYTAKHSGRGQVILFEPELKHPGLVQQSDPTVNHDRIMAMLQNGDLRIMASPVAPPQTPLSIGFYQLSITPQELQTLGLDEFHQSAQQQDLPLQLDHWLVDQILGAYGAAIAKKGMTLAIPLSPAGLMDQKLMDKLLARRDFPGCPGVKSLIISLNGAAFMENYPAIEAPLQLLRRRGNKLMLDQFGDNFSSFNKLPAGIIDYIKLPNRFIHSLHNSQMDEMMVTIINGHIHRLNARSIAGPAHLSPVLDKLRLLGIDLAEGASVSRAIPLAVMLDNGYAAIG
ncbi:diguanylate cyclase [Sodalis sp. dw_96]|uniref:diguanylate cyclase n=1 Tax=Sodalis sp. dw_96 TaxID=2719794 RepID=UPI001BD62728|nr:diguanylate cyclase [Sodalis sp. dw_96]